MSRAAERTDDLLADRRAKLERLREAGIEPFPHDFADRTEIAAVRDGPRGARGRGRDRGPRTGSPAGSPPAAGMGKASFLDLRDGTGQIQVQARARRPGRRATRACSSLDLGDIVGDRRHRLHVQARRAERPRRGAGTLLAKSLRPPPDKFHGLEDVETRYRQRELDLMANEETRELFLKRGEDDRRDPRAGSTTAGSSRSRRRSCSRSTAARSRAPSSPTTTRSTATSTCGSPPSST